MSPLTVSYLTQNKGFVTKPKTNWLADEQQQRPTGHRRHASDQLLACQPHPVTLQPHPDIAVGGLPRSMQKLSISNPRQSPPPMPAVPIEPHVTEGSSLYQYARQQPSRLAPLPHHRSPRNMHSRSFSDYSHPYPPLYGNRDFNSNNATSGYLHPGYHRRAISTNTLDVILQRPAESPAPLYSTSTSTATTSTLSPTLSPTTTTTTSSTKPIATGGDDSESQSDCSEKQSSSTTTSNNNKYHCPYCDKGFSRPSSLRIHTYSHTGEKPFECPEEGCSRKFSVQSNMRRHLRVHRLGRTTKRSTSDRSVKQTTTATTQWMKQSVFTATP